jgi:hypothetical protein
VYLDGEPLTELPSRRTTPYGMSETAYSIYLHLSTTCEGILKKQQDGRMRSGLTCLTTGTGRWRSVVNTGNVLTAPGTAGFWRILLYRVSWAVPHLGTGGPKCRLARTALTLQASVKRSCRTVRAVCCPPRSVRTAHVLSHGCPKNVASISKF